MEITTRKDLQMETMTDVAARELNGHRGTQESPLPPFVIGAPPAWAQTTHRDGAGWYCDREVTIPVGDEGFGQMDLSVTADYILDYEAGAVHLQQTDLTFLLSCLGGRFLVVGPDENHSSPHLAPVLDEEPAEVLLDGLGAYVLMRELATVLGYKLVRDEPSLRPLLPSA